MGQAKLVIPNYHTTQGSAHTPALTVFKGHPVHQLVGLLHTFTQHRSGIHLGISARAQEMFQFLYGKPAGNLAGLTTTHPVRYSK
jgi:hypothetical protein